MTRLIDAENLKAAAVKNCPNCANNGRDYCRVSCPINDFLDSIDEAPTIYGDDPIELCKKSIELGYSAGKIAGRIEKAKETTPDAGAKKGGGAHD